MEKSRITLECSGAAITNGRAGLILSGIWALLRWFSWLADLFQLDMIKLSLKTTQPLNILTVWWFWLNCLSSSGRTIVYQYTTPSAAVPFALAPHANCRSYNLKTDTRQDSPTLEDPGWPGRPLNKQNPLTIQIAIMLQYHVLQFVRSSGKLTRWVIPVRFI